MKGKIGKEVLLLLVLLSLTVFGSTLYSYMRLVELNRASSSSILALKDHISSNLRSGYCAVIDIDAGAMITDGMVIQSSTIVSNMDQSKFITSDDIGKVATISISAGTPIVSDMVSAQLASDYKERECSFIWLNTNLEDNDFVDVRILFPNGEDYIVAAKKSIKNVNVAVNNVFLWLTEEEIQLLDAAIVDANLHSAKIYVTKYVKPEVQEASTPTYEPNSDVMRVMESNPNIVTESARVLSLTARAAMEQRMELFEKVYPGFELNLEAGSNGMSSGAGTEGTVSIENGTNGENDSDSVPVEGNAGEVEYVD